MLEITGTKYEVFYGMAKQGFQYYTALKKHLEYNTNIGSYVKFSIKLKALRKYFLDGTGFENEVANGRRVLKPNTLKTTDFHNTLALELLFHPKKYPYRVITEILNHHCKIEGLASVSESWVKSLIRTNKEIKNLTTAYRSGKKRFSDTMQTYLVRKKSKHPANCWMIDGTPLQFFTISEDGQRKERLNLFVIIDVCTRKIVGFDISKSEDRFNILNALKMAVMLEGHLPAEIVSDNFSANKTEEIKHLQMEMEKLGTYWRFAHVGNAQDKSYVERFFGVFQSLECALYGDYLGEGITSKRDNRPSPEYLAEYTRKNGYTTYKEHIKRVAIMIASYNNTTRPTIECPNETYKTLEKPNAREMDLLKTALLFWNTTKFKIARSMVKITVKKVAYHFDIPTNVLKLELHGQTVRVRYDLDDMSFVYLFDYDTDDFICECKASLKAHTGQIEQTEEDRLTILKVDAKKKSFEKHIATVKSKIIDKGLEQINKETLSINLPLSRTKEALNSVENQQLLSYSSRVHGFDLYAKEKEPLPISEIKHSKTKEYKDMVTKRAKKKGSNKPIEETDPTVYHVA